MYLARQRTRNKIHYSIRHSYADGSVFKSGELFDLGTDPGCFIHYPGGSGYYFDSIIEETLAQKGIETDQNQLDRIFFEFLPPAIQRVISGFDRGYGRRSGIRHQTDTTAMQPVHIFDKRRFHYLRFGYSRQQGLHRIPQRMFSPLQSKSRDELEHYFLENERRLPMNEISTYTAIVFEMHHWRPDPSSQLSWTEQMDAFFIRQLCDLNSDEQFMAGVPPFAGLSAYLVRYAIFYFDYAPPLRSAEQEYIHDFINRHRVHRPPQRVQIKMAEAAKLFGRPWKTLKKMSRAQLTRAYRRLALEHHPDQGGDPDKFRRLTQYYQALLSRKPRG